MTEPSVETKEGRAALRALCDRATPINEHIVINRYDHGGGRVFRQLDSGGRDLIADLYGDGEDRECWIAARTALPTALDLLDSRDAHIANLEDEIANLRAQYVQVPREPDAT